MEKKSKINKRLFRTIDRVNSTTQTSDLNAISKK